MVVLTNNMLLFLRHDRQCRLDSGYQKHLNSILDADFPAATLLIFSHRSQSLVGIVAQS